MDGRSSNEAGWQLGCSGMLALDVMTRKKYHICVRIIKHISDIRKLKANVCGREKEGHFRYKNFLRALK